ncbi:MAG: MFS transporter, partial [Actinomycetota bacterium]
ILITSHFAGIFIMPLISGELADKFGRKPVSCLGFGLFLLGLLAAILTSNIYIYTFAVFLIGGGFGIIEGTMTTILVDLNRDNESMVINVSQVFFVIGALSGPLMVSLFLSKGYDWKSLYAIFAAISLIYLIYFALLPFRKAAYSAGKLKGTIVMKLLREPLMMLFVLSILMYVGIEQGISFYINTYIKTMTVSEFIPSLILSAFWGFMIAGRLSCGYLSKKYNAKKIIIILTIFSAAALLVVIFSTGYIFAGIGFSLLGFGLSGIWPLIMYLASTSYPKYSGTAIGIMMASSAMGGMIIPFLSSAAGAAFGTDAGIASLLLPAAVIVFSQLFIIRKLKRN